MKNIYWRPRGVSRTALALIAVFSFGGMYAVEKLQIVTRVSNYREKEAASQLALQAMEALKVERIKHEPDIDPITDPSESGLIGLAMTSVTSDPGVLAAKQTSVNPNFAAVIVKYLKESKLKEGDVVAVGCSGSFPAMNVCVYAALATLKLQPIIISSAAASQWGANMPDFLWIDMEKCLSRDNIFGFRSVAASIGGPEDNGAGMDPEGPKLLAEAIKRNELEFIEAKSPTQSIEKRMGIYHKYAKGAPIKAYINVGGGTVSVGTSIGKKLFEPGLNLRPPAASPAKHIDSIMNRFSEQPVPIIHLTQVEQLAARNGLPLAPKDMPDVGKGNIFLRRHYNLWLAGGVLLAIILSLYAFIRTELGYRILQTSKSSKDGMSHEPMI